MAKQPKTQAGSKTTVSTATKDKGSVKVGGGAIRFASTTDKGVVHVGGGAMRF
jgi:hypothetical protein